MADKLTQTILDALAKAAAEPAGLPLFAAKGEPGLFPAAAAGKPAAQKAQADELVRVVRTETKGKSARDLFALTDAGWEFLLAGANPKQVLEDFVRALEAREGEVGDLLAVARRMADSIGGMKDAVARVLPRVTAARLNTGEPQASARGVFAPHAVTSAPGSLSANGHHAMNGVALLESPAVGRTDREELAEAVLARLSDWAASAAASEDCPLPELFRGLSTRDPAPTIGEFHDCLRALSADGRVYLHPWTAPLYTLPEPAYALLAGHNVAYYASARP